MASWADEFDIDDSDILGALNRKRKEISQLASPPWGALAAAPPSPPPPQRALEPPPSSIAASASFLKRFQKPRPSQNGLSLLQSPTVDAFRKRKQGFDATPPLHVKAAHRQSPTLEYAIAGEKPGHPEVDHSQDEASVCSVDKRCHPLSSHGLSPTLTSKGNPYCYPRHAESQNILRNEETLSSLEPLAERQQNLISGHGKAAFMPPKAWEASKQNLSLDKVQLRRMSFAQAQENDYSTRLNQIPNASQQEHDLMDKMDCVPLPNADQHLKTRMPSIQKSPVLDASPDAGLRENSVRAESRGTRPLRKDLEYQIPGPAGTVQRGLGQKIKSACENDQVGNNNVAPCRVSVLDDAEFQSGPWLKAKNYLDKFSISVSTISSIKTCRTENRIPKLVAVIKTCTPNGCGDVMVNLKDPSDFINGTVNRKVMNETEFGRFIEPGAVIVLQQVAVFSPTPYAHYLNITINNVEQVYAKGVQFFRGECSKAAAKEAWRGMTEDKELNGEPSHSNLNKAGICAEKEGRRRSVFELLEEEDELEILLAPSGNHHKM